MITPHLILSQHDTKQGQWSVKFCSGDRVCWRLRASVFTTCCDFYLRVLSVQCVFGRFVYNGFKILTNLHNMNLHISLLSPSKSSVLLDLYCSLPATKGSSTEQNEQPCKIYKVKGSCHNPQKSWLITKILSLEVTTNKKKTSFEALWLVSITNSVTASLNLSIILRNKIWFE